MNTAPNYNNDGAGEAVRDEALPVQARVSLQTTLIKIVPVAVLAIVVVAAVQVTPLKEYVEDIDRLRAVVSDLGVWAPFLGLLVGALAIAAGFPRTLFSLLAGMLFGVITGIAVAHMAAVAGSWTTFAVARMLPTEWLRTRVKNRHVLAFLKGTPGPLTVAMIRQLPFPGVAQNLALALTRSRHRAFLGGSLLGMLPISILFALVGAGIGSASAARALVPPISALIVAIAGLAWFRRSRKPVPVQPEDPATES